MSDDLNLVDDFSETMLYTPEIEIPRKVTKTEESPFETLPLTTVIKEVYDQIVHLQELLHLPGSMISARIMLTHYKWNMAQLASEYWDSDPDTFFQKINILNPFNALPGSTDETDDCKICFSADEDTARMYELACGHRFCRTCWDRHLTTQIVDEDANVLSCPEPQCRVLISDEDIMHLVTNAEVYDLYRRSVCKMFVLYNEALRWCPSTGCNYVIKRHRPTKAKCACKCGFEFCFECRAEYWHEPVTCIQLKMWKKGLEGDSETYKWMAAHAKVCPKCEAVIEKNGGCNHMTCRNCKHEFCWICMGDWTRVHACNRFQESEHHIETKLRELARFNHFRDRYVNQFESLRLEVNHYRDPETIVENMKDNFEMSNNEVRFMRDAIKVLQVSRRTLTYTFVFAYFLQKNNHVEIFEENQSDLERAVERLSGFLEEPMTTETVVELKRNIQDSYKYCEVRCNVLMEHIREAEEKHLWQMNGI